MWEEVDMIECVLHNDWNCKKTKPSILHNIRKFDKIEECMWQTNVAPNLM